MYRYGPLRGVWCFGFEGYNKVIKAGGKLSNYKNETTGIMKYWSLLSARDLEAAKQRKLPIWDASLCSVVNETANY